MREDDLEIRKSQATSSMWIGLPALMRILEDRGYGVENDRHITVGALVV